MTSSISKEALSGYINRIERLETEKSELAEGIKEVFAEASASGFDAKAMRRVLRLKKQDKNKLAEEEALVELYREALGI